MCLRSPAYLSSSGISCFPSDRPLDSLFFFCFNRLLKKNAISFFLVSHKPNPHPKGEDYVFPLYRRIFPPKMSSNHNETMSSLLTPNCLQFPLLSPGTLDSLDYHLLQSSPNFSFRLAASIVSGPPVFPVLEEPHFPFTRFPFFSFYPPFSFGFRIPSIDILFRFFFLLSFYLFFLMSGVLAFFLAPPRASCSFRLFTFLCVRFFHVLPVWPPDTILADMQSLCVV